MLWWDQKADASDEMLFFADLSSSCLALALMEMLNIFTFMMTLNAKFVGMSTSEYLLKRTVQTLIKQDLFVLSTVRQKLFPICFYSSRNPSTTNFINFSTSLAMYVMNSQLNGHFGNICLLNEVNLCLFHQMKLLGLFTFLLNSLSLQRRCQ